MTYPDPHDWHKLSHDELYEALGSAPGGLSTAGAEHRLSEYGENVIAEAKGTPLILKFLANFYHTFALLLWVLVVLSFSINSPELGWATVIVILINALFSFWQEFQAEKAVDALKKLIPSYAKVMRDGDVQKILSAEVVPGDLIVLEEGDNIAADARLVEEFEMRTNNSTLTGESEPVRKSADLCLDDCVTQIEAPNIVFTGTSVAYGNGKAVVFATGMETQFGRIASLTQKVKPELSPLQKEVNKVALIVAGLAVGMGAVMFFVGYSIAKLSVAVGITFAMGMVAANVPEGLLPTLSLALATGVREMAKRHALVKKLSSVETLGSTTVICTDKTGTLTQNEMTVRELWFAGKQYEVTGVGYAPEGGFELNGAAVPAEELRALRPLFRGAASCNNSKVRPPEAEGKAWTILGDPTEAAMLVAAGKGGVDREEADKDSPRVYELPFDSKRKMMSVVNLDSGGRTAYVKGAPNEVLARCVTFLGPDGPAPLDDATREAINAANDEYARNALRVLAVASRALPREVAEFTTESVEAELTFVGLMAMMDPPRPEVAEAVGQCHTAGIRIIMITGDYGLTAESIARKIGIVTGEARILSGAELDNIDDKGLQGFLSGGEVIFARVSPEHKMRVVANLKELGEVVAVTGDGVNDAPALKKADIGVAMGITGTDVAKEAATMILTDDNFASIVHAIEEGRVIYENIKKFVVYIFAHLGPEAVPFMFFVLGGKAAIPLGLTAMQILAIDIGTETLPALALGLEKAEPGIMERPPRSKKDGLLNMPLLGRAYLFFGLLEGAMVMSGIFWALHHVGWRPGMDVMAPSSPQHWMFYKAATMGFAGIVVTQIGTVFACRTNRVSVFKVGLFSNRWILWGILFEIIVTVAIIYVPLFQRLFDTMPLTWQEWAFMLWYAPVLFMADEGRKYIVRKRQAPATPAAA